jgi:anaerobic sulfite reductase subunit C
MFLKVVIIITNNSKGRCRIVEMRWSPEAKDALKKVPFFVRKRVKKRVEEEASRCGDDLVTLQHVTLCRNRFLEKMFDEIKGYQVETCFGPDACSNRAAVSDGLIEEIERMLAGKDLEGFLKAKVDGPLKFHHEFRISVSDCPNACSRPQIVDIGLIGASTPKRGKEPCNQCSACVEACKESAIFLGDDGPVIDEAVCLGCGACIRACPTGTLEVEKGGYRVLLGGKLGRHPRLGEELPGIHAPEEIPDIVERFVDIYRSLCREGERLGVIMERVGKEKFLEEPGKSEPFDLCQGKRALKQL